MDNPTPLRDTVSMLLGCFEDADDFLHELSKNPATAVEADRLRAALADLLGIERGSKPAVYVRGEPLAYRQTFTANAFRALLDAVEVAEAHEGDDQDRWDRAGDDDYDAAVGA